MGDIENSLNTRPSHPIPVDTPQYFGEANRLVPHNTILKCIKVLLSLEGQPRRRS